MRPGHHSAMPDPLRVRQLATDELTADEVAAIRSLLDAAFAPQGDEAFTEDDWQHALGGVHFVADVAGEIAGHAAVVERDLRVAGSPVRTGYVEAVATAPARHRQGIGTAVMTAVGTHLAEHFKLGALGTGQHGFYRRLGWRTWQGPSLVRTDAGDRSTPEEDGYIMVLLTPRSPPLDLQAPISCEWRPGDVW